MAARKIILDKGQAPGDIVVFTGALRDLKRQYPDWEIDVRSCCMDVFANNPHITPLEESAPGVEYHDVGYSDVHQSNHSGRHFSAAYHLELEDLLGIRLRQTEIFPDLHLSADEKAAPCQVSTDLNYDGPFWLINSGNKDDFPLKQWGFERWQRFVDLLRDRVQFVQIGELSAGHHHPLLSGVMDLRGRTTLRQLIVLSSRAQGAVGHVSLLMHLMGAWRKPCVVLAGGREPWRWEAYPQHQYLHTCGALPCCDPGGCWLSGNVEIDIEHVRTENKRCRNMRGNSAGCMAMISPETAARAVTLYLDGGVA
jgi:ADP-heptose:LPS heptosyltransferase